MMRMPLAGIADSWQQYPTGIDSFIRDDNRSRLERFVKGGSGQGFLLYGFLSFSYRYLLNEPSGRFRCHPGTARQKQSQTERIGSVSAI
jgi:hypothetical protein